ncbi:YjgN family protein [Halopseudomonas maritima]|uniref:YjgN family protein n=1 Tax=Halopseudomonas maritima TaxID=2918528 RepID=UPI001EEC7C9E|nr:YjgN family protein [Halopseudomonas maritima]UJJ32415.1 DUF898 domain-containing protein [Halopseudomonas maritima]
MHDTFKVSCKGERDGALGEQQLRENLLRLGFGSRQVDRLLSGTPVIIKSGLSETMAMRYQQRLREAGLLTEVVPEGAAVQAETVPQGGAAVPPVGTAPRPAPGELPQRRMAPFAFTGNGSEYFGIWIVNILLMVVTLGFYAPWAKVRNLQYFYGHTLLEQQSFQYLADPWVIFRGRLVAVAAFIVWTIASNFFPIAAMALLVLFIPLVPWIIVRSLKFHAINSAYRNIRFDFTGRYWQAVQVVYLWPLLALLTLGLMVPFAVQRWHQFLTGNARYGRSAFALNLSVGEVYVFFLKMLGMFVATLLLGGLLSVVYQPLMAVFVFAAYLVLFGYVMAGLTNLVINGVKLEQHGFVSNLGKRRLLWIFFTNSLLILLTMGFFTPWAKVRMATYRASCTEMEVAGDLDGFIAGEAQHAGAVGMELGDAFDVGFGFG